MAELTTSRINRQFRTLRSKCAALSSVVLTPPKPTVAITYGHTARSRVEDEPPPLAILQSLDKLTTRLHLDRAIVETMQLSKRIYEVRDAFKNIVQSAFGPPENTPHSITSLAGICARVVGEHIQSEIMISTESASEEDTRSQIMDELYDNVPGAYRQYTFVAHALTYILDNCPHHPTLLNALLEVCISYSLLPEASTTLRMLFIVSILPRPNSTWACPLTHPAHKNFLTSLRDTCVVSGSDLTMPPTSPILNDRTFTRILVDALSEPYPEQLHAWTSRAVAKLARELRKVDFAGCFVPLVSGLALSLAAQPAAKKQKNRPSSGVHDVYSKMYDDALERLAKWLVSMLEVLHTMDWTNGSEEYRACVDLLAEIERYQLHVVSSPSTSPAACVADALCCLAAYCLASPQGPPIPAADPALLIVERLLRTAQVKHQTFDGLISHIFPLPSFSVFRMPLAEVGDDTPTPPPTQPTVSDGGLGAIDALAAPLRGRNLPQCEVALFRGALGHVEALISAPSHTLPPTFSLTQKEMYDLRRRLLNRAEAAERRCYGSASDPSRPPDGESEWVWEEMVGSWVMKSPAPTRAKKVREENLARTAKRRKLEGGHASGSLGLSQSSSTSHSSIHRQASLRFHGSFSPLRLSASASSRRAMPGTATSARSTSRAALEDIENSSEVEEYDMGTDPLISGETDTTPAPKRVRRFAQELTSAKTNITFPRSERNKSKTIHKPKPKPKPRASAPAHIFAIPALPPSASPLARRRSAFNFDTLLADAHKNAISLREERARERALAESEASRKTQATNVGKLKCKRVYGSRSSESDNDDDDPRANVLVLPDSSPIRAGPLEPSSDDALDLFAYADSSPVPLRRRAR